MSRCLPLCLLIALAGARSARAQPTGADQRLRAEALFQEGRKLMAQGKIDAGCEKLDASYRLDPAVGTLLNLADCDERRGRTASAWAEFKEAAALARSANQERRASEADRRADKLEKGLARLTLVLDGDPREVTVTKDGRALEAALMGTAVPTDPGDFRIAASAPGRRTWEIELSLHPGEQKMVAIPRLEPIAIAAVTPPPAVAAPSLRAEARSVPSAPRSAATGPWIAGGAALAAAGVGTYFGVSALSQWGDVPEACRNGTLCSAADSQTSSDAARAGNIATGAFVVAGVAVVVAGVLWWLDRGPPSQAAH